MSRKSPFVLFKKREDENAVSEQVAARSYSHQLYTEMAAAAAKKPGRGASAGIDPYAGDEIAYDIDVRLARLKETPSREPADRLSTATSMLLAGATLAASKRPLGNFAAKAKATGTFSPAIDRVSRMAPPPGYAGDAMVRAVAKCAALRATETGRSMDGDGAAAEQRAFALLLRCCTAAMCTGRVVGSVFPVRADWMTVERGLVRNIGVDKARVANHPELASAVEELSTALRGLEQTAMTDLCNVPMAFAGWQEGLDEFVRGARSVDAWRATMYASCLHEYLTWSACEAEPLRIGGATYRPLRYGTWRDVLRRAARGYPHVVRFDRVGAPADVRVVILLAEDGLPAYVQVPRMAVEWARRAASRTCATLRWSTGNPPQRRARTAALATTRLDAVYGTKRQDWFPYADEVPGPFVTAAALAILTMCAAAVHEYAASSDLPFRATLAAVLGADRAVVAADAAAAYCSDRRATDPEGLAKALADMRLTSADAVNHMRTRVGLAPVVVEESSATVPVTDTCRTEQLSALLFGASTNRGSYTTPERPKTEVTFPKKAPTAEEEEEVVETTEPEPTPRKRLRKTPQPTPSVAAPSPEVPAPPAPPAKPEETVEVEYGRETPRTVAVSAEDAGRAALAYAEAKVTERSDVSIADAARWIREADAKALLWRALEKIAGHTVSESAVVAGKYRSNGRTPVESDADAFEYAKAVYEIAIVVAEEKGEDVIGYMAHDRDPGYDLCVLKTATNVALAYYADADNYVKDTILNNGKYDWKTVAIPRSALQETDHTRAVATFVAALVDPENPFPGKPIYGDATKRTGYEDLLLLIACTKHREAATLIARHLKALARARATLAYQRDRMDENPFMDATAVLDALKT